MDIGKLLDDKSKKSLEKRKEIEDALISGAISVPEISRTIETLDDKKTAITLEALEAVSGRNPEIADIEWIRFAEKFINSKSNSLKRESSRIVGNIAHLFPDDLEKSIQMLMENTTNDGTVVRWGSAYALAKIVVIPQYANSDLYSTMEKVYEMETENGVKNQYSKGLKKASKLRT